jgi:hypothetical protein
MKDIEDEEEDEEEIASDLNPEGRFAFRFETTLFNFVQKKTRSLRKKMQRMRTGRSNL